MRHPDVAHHATASRPTRGRQIAAHPAAGSLGFAYLATARQARLASRACPDLESTYRARARFWLAMARRVPAPDLP